MDGVQTPLVPSFIHPAVSLALRSPKVMVPLRILIVSVAVALSSAQSLTPPFLISPCGFFEEWKRCGTPCPLSCESLNQKVCCEQKCVYGCFCKDGYILQSNYSERKCIPIDDCPKPGVIQFALPQIVVLESEGTLRVVLVRSEGEAGAVGVQWRAKDSTAKNDRDYIVARSGLVNFDPHEKQKFIDITIVDDGEREEDEVFELQLFGPSGGAVVGPIGVMTITIKDNDRKPGSLEFKANSYTYPENAGFASLVVVRNGGTDGTVRSSWTVSDDTAVRGEDYLGIPSGDITFRDGVTAQTINIPIVDDKKKEPDEHFAVKLSSPRGGATLGEKVRSTVTIVDNDRHEGKFEFEFSNVTVNEDDGVVRLTVVRREGSDGRVVFRWKTLDRTATRGEDYENFEGDIVFRDGQTKNVIEINIFDDHVKEEDEQFLVQLLPVSGTASSSLGRNTIVTVTIKDNDKIPGRIEFQTTNIVVAESVDVLRLAVVRIDGTDGTVSVTWTVRDKTAVRGQDYEVRVSGQVVFTDGVSRQTIDIRILDDKVRESSEQFVVELSSPRGGAVLGSKTVATITITDNDSKPGVPEFQVSTSTVSESAGTSRLVVLRRQGSDGRLPIRWRTSDRTAIRGQDYVEDSGELVFEDGQTTKTLFITIINDDIPEDDETFVVELLTVTARPATLGVQTTATVKITDDDRNRGSLEFQSINITVEENSGSVRLNVLRLKGTEGTVTVRWRTVDKTAIRGQDYSGEASGLLTFKDRVQVRSISIPIIDDKRKESDETFTIEIFSPTGGATLGIKTVATITILDNDRKPGIIQFGSVSLSVSENVGRVRLFVLRTQGTDGTVGVQWKVSDRTAVRGSDYLSPISGELTFHDGVQQQNISFPIINDKVKEFSEQFTVQLFSATGGALLGDKTTAVVTILDGGDDLGKINILTTHVKVPEKNSSAQVIVARTGSTDGTVLVKWKLVDKTAVKGQDYKEPSSLVSTFRHGVARQVIEIPILDDRIEEADETFSLLFDSIIEDNAIIGDKREATITIIDDDQNAEFFEFETTNIQVSEKDGVVQLAVIRTGGSRGKVVIGWETRDRTARKGSDYIESRGELVFLDGETKRLIEIVIVDDKEREGDETFVVELLTVTARYIGFGRKTSATVTILQNDYSPGIIHFDKSDLTVTESGTLVAAVVREGGSDGRVSVKYTTTDVSALKEYDYRKLRRNTLIFEDGEVVKYLIIETVNDFINEPIETFQVVLGDPQGGAVIGEVKVLTVTIVDDDKMIECRVEFEKTTIRVKENHGPAELVVKRSESFEKSLVLRVKTEDNTALVRQDYVEQDYFIRFQPGERKKTIEIPIINDQTSELDEEFWVIITPTKDGNLLSNQFRANVVIEDDDDVQHVSCEGGKIYTSCVPACQISCTQPSCPIPAAHAPCVPGCVCPHALKLDRLETKCVSECPGKKAFVKVGY